MARRLTVLDEDGLRHLIGEDAVFTTHWTRGPGPICGKQIPTARRETDGANTGVSDDESLAVTCIPCMSGENALDSQLFSLLQESVEQSVIGKAKPLTVEQFKEAMAKAAANAPKTIGKTIRRTKRRDGR